MSNSPAHASAPGHGHEHGHGHDAHAHDIKKHVRVYLAVFGALIAGTFLTVFMYSVHFSSMTITITVALFIATVKALLVAGFFMHLISEKKAIYSTLAVTLFFFAAMMYITVWSRDQLPRGSEYFGSKYIPHPMEPAAK
jgi:cytochrome c oxidase subunit 4